MNKYIFFSVFIFSTGCSFIGKEGVEQECIVITGCNAADPILNKAALSYNEENPSVVFSISSEGNTTAIDAMVKDMTDIAATSNPVDWEGKIDPTIGIEEEIVAYDALAIIVNPSNSVSKLTLQQVRKIFSGEFTNWKQLGGVDQDIVIIHKDPCRNGVNDYFTQTILGGNSAECKAQTRVFNKDILNDVKKIPYAIACISNGFVDNEVKAVAVSANGKEFYTPEKVHILNLNYPIVQPLYMYYRKDRREKVYHFMTYLLSQKGQALIENSNYISKNRIGGDVLPFSAYDSPN